ncbi:MAG: WD40 repeat domain-containing protein [Armatimonadota bacterium]
MGTRIFHSFRMACLSVLALVCFLLPVGISAASLELLWSRPVLYTSSTVVSPDGKLLAIPAGFGGVNIYNGETGTPITTLQTGLADGYMRKLAFSPDNTLLIIGLQGLARDERAGPSVKCLEVQTGKVLWQSPDTSFAFTADGLLVTAGDGIYFREARSGDIRRHYTLDTPINKVETTADGVLLACITNENLLLVDGKTGQITRRWANTEKWPAANMAFSFTCGWPLAFSPDGSLLLGATSSKELTVWSTKDGSEVRRFNNKDQVFGQVIFATDNVTLIHNDRSSIIFINLTDGTESRRIPIKWNPRICSVSREGKHLIVAAQDRVLRWNLENKTAVFEIAPSLSPYHPVITLSPDGTLITGTSLAGDILLLRAIDGVVVRTIPPEVCKGTAQVFSPDGTLIAVSSLLNVVLVRAMDGLVMKTLKADIYSNAMCFTSDGTRLLIVGAGVNRKNQVQVWGITDGTLLRTIETGLDGLPYLVLSPDGHTIAVNGSQSRQVALWDIDTGQQIGTPIREIGWYNSFAFSPSGQEMLIYNNASRQGIKVIDIATAQVKGNVPNTDVPIMLSKNGKVAVYNSHYLYPVSSSVSSSVVDGVTFIPIPLKSMVRRIAISADGQVVATSSPDGLSVWKVKP